MRLGLLADIHEAIEHLDTAIGALRAEGVDRFVLLGDLFETGHRLDELLDRLEPLDALAVWGNHDIGLCRDVSGWSRARFSPRILGYFGRLVPRVEIEGCRFQHTEPYLDPETIDGLWGLEEPWPPDPARCFATEAGDFDVAFSGHRHAWAHVTPDGPSPWRGGSSLVLDPGRRHVVVLHGVQQGHCAHFDTATRVLRPFSLG